MHVMDTLLMRHLYGLRRRGVRYIYTDALPLSNWKGFSVVSVTVRF